MVPISVGEPKHNSLTRWENKRLFGQIVEECVDSGPHAWTGTDP
jgi:hypothetical protein